MVISGWGTWWMSGIWGVFVLGAHACGVILSFWTFCSGLGRPSVGTLREEVEPPLPDFPARWGRAWVVGDVAELRLGARRYELSDWLGGVRVVVTDRRIPIRGNNQVVVGYRAEVVSVTDYYSYGAEISMRSYEAQPWYRYGYQAQEKDHEIYGKGAMYHYTYRQHDARLGRFWSVDPLARKYPWNSPYAFAENDVVSSVELEGLESWQVNASISATFGGDSRSRGLGYLNFAFGVAGEIPLGKETGLMIAQQWTLRTHAGGLGGTDQPERMRFQIVVSTGLGYGQGNAPAMDLELFNSRMLNVLSTSHKNMVMLAMNYVADGERSQWVGSAMVRRGDVQLIAYNDIVPGYFMYPRRDQNETGGLRGSILCRSCLGVGGIRTFNFGTEVYTDKPMLITNEDGSLKEAIDEDLKYYKVHSPQLNAGMWFFGVNGESSNGYTWMARLYTIGGELGMALQNVIHDLKKEPRFKSSLPLGVGVAGGVGQTIRP
jgi:RHS repeat-associated protein